MMSRLVIFYCVKYSDIFIIIFVNKRISVFHGCLNIFIKRRVRVLLMRNEMNKYSLWAVYFDGLDFG